MQRRWVIGGLILLVAAVAGYALLRADQEPEPKDLAGQPIAPEAGENAASSLEGGPPEVLVLSGSSLVRQDVEEQSEEVLREVATPNVYAAQGSHWVALVTSEEAQGAGEDDFAAEPVLTLLDLSSEDEHEIGPGVQPMWNPLGTAVAYLEPVEPRDCAGEACSGETTVNLASSDGEVVRTLLPPGKYNLITWAGDRVLVADQEDPDETITVDVEGNTASLDIPPNEIWDASPDGRWLLRVADKIEFLPLVDGQVEGDSVRIPTEGKVLADGSWSPNSDQVAAVLVDQGEGVDQVGVFSPESPRPRVVDESVGATGPLLWSPDSSSLLVTILVPEEGLFQASYCPVPIQGSCRAVKTWADSVVPLRLE